MLRRRDSYEALCRGFSWNIPTRFNIGSAVSDDWAMRAPDRVAVFDYRQEGEAASLTYGELAERSSAFASALKARGLDAATASRFCCRNVSRP